MSSPIIVVLSSSLSQNSRSRIMARYAVQSLAANGVDARLLDLAQFEIAAYPHSSETPGLRDAAAQFNSAHGWVLASPVYNFGASGVLLNFLHYALDNSLGRWKPFMLMSSMSGQRSAMALDHLARTLIYEVSAVQVGPTLSNIGDTGASRITGEISEELRQRIDAQLAVLRHYAQARSVMES